MPSENTLHIAIELSFSSWLVAARLPGAEKSRLHRIKGGGSGALLTLIAELRSRTSAKAITLASAALRRSMMAGGGVRNPPSRGAVCEQHKHGSVGAGAGNRSGYPTVSVVECRSSGALLDEPSQTRSTPTRRPDPKHMLRISSDGANI